VHKKVSVLSGGEKSRIAMAKTLLMEANFLLLDEPTNHLDMTSVNILINALQQFEGTYAVISHDRHFISSIANKIWYIEDKLVKEYPGTYEEFVYWQSLQAKTPSAQALKKAENSAKKNTNKPATPVQSDAEAKKQKTELSKCEKEIADLELKIKTLDTEMSSPEVYTKPEKMQKLSNEQKQNKAKLEALHKMWEDIFMKVEA
jgi:ATP-binding cassette subfamily F protein 3